MDDKTLELERETQTLRLELQEHQKTIERLKQELERTRGVESARLADARFEKLFSESATPISQLLTQIHLLKVENKPVRAEDIAAVANRLVRVLEEHGLKAEGEIGQSVSFDPNHHDPISGDSVPSLGETVQIRMVGISYQGKLLRKTGVL